MIITITNERNNLKMSFLGGKEFREKYGIKTKREKAQIAINYNDYELNARGLSGLFSLPPSISFMNSGFKQNGSDFQYNTYENRIITFDFQQFYGYNNSQQTQVINQLEHMLRIDIQTENGNFHTFGHLNGTIETGVFELECPDPYLYNGKQVVKRETILVSPKGRAMFPMTMPQIFFGGAQEQGSIELYAKLPTDFFVELKGKFNGITIYGYSAGANLTYNGQVNTSMVISTLDQTTYVDGIDVTDRVTGIYPTLVEGDNVFMFKIPKGNQQSDVAVRIHYMERVGNIE